MGLWKNSLALPKIEPGNYCTASREISADLAGKERQGKKGKLRRKIGKFKKGKVENWKWKEEKLQNDERKFQNDERTFFSKPLKFVLGLPKWKFSTGKKHFTPGKVRKNDFAPCEKFSHYAPAASKSSTILQYNIALWFYSFWSLR